MLILLKMAFRNIQRNTRRSLLAAISVGLALFMVIFLQGYINGMKSSVIYNSTKSESGHIQLVTKEYLKNRRFMPITENIPDPDELIAFLRSDPAINQEVDFITERFFFGMLLQYEGNNKAAIAFGGDVEQERKMLMLDRALVEGRYLSSAKDPESKEREIILGRKVADVLKLKVGDTLKVLVSGSDYSLHIPTLKVAGIFKTGINALDDSTFQMSLQDAQEILHTGGGSQQILIMLKDYRQAKKVARLIQKRLAGDGRFQNIVAVPWDESGGFAQTMVSMEQLYNLIYIVIAFLGSFIITNIMMMVVLERRKEIGIIKSMGFSRGEILGMFLMEGSILGLIGSISGVALGSLVSIYFMVHGIDFGSMLSDVNMPIDNVIKFIITVPGIISTMFLGIIVAAIVSILPSRQASKMNVVDAIKSV
ncbi:MAG: ABC transporter permease [Firmicutes bacterium]|nr:ABC transporter permease [Bacillota bacterium]